MRVAGPNNCQFLWARPVAQRSVAASILFGVSGAIVVVWLFIKTQPHWVYYLLGAIYIGLCWRGAIRLAAASSRGLAAPESTGVSLGVLGFQLGLVALVVGVIRAQLSSGSVALLLVALVLGLGWVVFALMTVRKSGVLHDEAWLGLDRRSLIESLRGLTGGLPRKDLDPVGCGLSLLLFVAVSWLAVIVWLAVGLLVPAISAGVFAAPRALTAVWAGRRSPQLLLPGLTLVWFTAFAALTEGVTRGVRAFIVT